MDWDWLRRHRSAQATVPQWKGGKIVALKFYYNPGFPGPLRPPVVLRVLSGARKFHKERYESVKVSEPTSSLLELLVEIRACRECEHDLPCGPRPILAAHQDAPILIIGQAPGRRVHDSGIAWDDPSGERLRDWLGVDSDDFYNESKIALVPMGFCYPGTGESGDLPPRPECARLWHERLSEELSGVKLTLLIGAYAQKYRLGQKRKRTLTATVQAWKEFRPACLPLPHPSPRNNRWMKKNPWFTDEVLPYLKTRVKRLLP